MRIKSQDIKSLKETGPEKQSDPKSVGPEAVIEPKNIWNFSGNKNLTGLLRN